MHTIEIPDIGFFKEIPESFSEMSQDDFLLFVRLYLRFAVGEIDYHRLRTEMVYQFLGMRHVRWRYELLDDVDREQVHANIFRVAELLGFFFIEEKRDGKIHLRINLSWTKNFLPSYRPGFTAIPGGIYKGPADTLADLTWIEYKDAHVSAFEYLKNGNEFDLNRLCAVLYRRPLLPFLPKPKYNPDKLDHRIPRVASWPHYIKYAILLNFLSCEHYIRTGTFNIDGNEITFGILYQESDEDTISSDTGLTGVLYNLAESHVFGTVKETANQSFFDVMFRLYQLRRDHLAMKANLEKQKES